METADRRRLEEQAAAVMAAAGRIPEPRVLAAMPDERLQELLDYWSGPLFVA